MNTLFAMQALSEVDNLTQSKTIAIAQDYKERDILTELLTDETYQQDDTRKVNGEEEEKEENGHIPTRQLLPLPSLSSLEENLRGQLNLQNFWVLSHTFTLIGSILYAYTLLWPNLLLKAKSYRMSTLSSLFTYLVVLYRRNYEQQYGSYDEKSFAARNTFSLSSSLRDENAQLLGYILLWNVSGQSLFKLVPFSIYSFLNITSFFTLEVFPDNALCNAIIPLLNYTEIPLLVFASYIDLLVFGVMGKETLETKNVYPFIIYALVWVLRFENSEASRSSINLIVKFLDRMIINSKDLVPDNVRAGWMNFRKHTCGYFPIEEETLEKDLEDRVLDDCASMTTS